MLSLFSTATLWNLLVLLPTMVIVFKIKEEVLFSDVEKQSCRRNVLYCHLLKRKKDKKNRIETKTSTFEGSKKR